MGMPEKSGRSGTPSIGLKMSGFPELARQYTIAANESISALRNRYFPPMRPRCVS
ncbi:hypothetical protein CEV34_1339 [Brucella pseudogrignonensis]|uniref:Uncharacterized protein n=1 Tax=Brucella pseudogrignonensis TaxID=419475 RepID=A0A256GNW7_9HYPH|nr:hypothetical protein CEV34_1339 [Brucella pseudogrignonensis]